jgi:hypothetical protein
LIQWLLFVARSVTIPALQPAVNFFAHPLYAYYRIVMCFNPVSDYVWNEAGSHYGSVSSMLPKYKPVNTPWMAAKIPQPSASYQFAPDNGVLPGPDMILVFGADIQYGMPGADGSIQPVPYAGAARILKSI